jgi:hypothetical protein
LKYLEKIGFRKTNESDRHIANIAVKTSWIVVVLALLGWSLYDLFSLGNISTPFIILSLGLAVYFFTMLYFRNQMSRADSD